MNETKETPTPAQREELEKKYQAKVLLSLNSPFWCRSYEFSKNLSVMYVDINSFSGCNCKHTNNHCCGLWDESTSKTKPNLKNFEKKFHKQYIFQLNCEDSLCFLVLFKEKNWLLLLMSDTSAQYSSESIEQEWHSDAFSVTLEYRTVHTFFRTLLCCSIQTKQQGHRSFLWCSKNRFVYLYLSFDCFSLVNGFSFCCYLLTNFLLIFSLTLSLSFFNRPSWTS